VSAGGKDAGSGGSATGGAATGGSAGTATGGTAGTGGSAGAGATCQASIPSPTVVDPKSAAELTVVGDPGAAGGIFDPSLEYPLNALAGAISYSAYQAKNSVSTRIAVSSDAGATFSYVASPNQAVDFNAPAPINSTRCPEGQCIGRLIHETSSLIFDLEDPDATRRWKLFTFSYMVLTGDVLAPDLGYIGLFTAPDPVGPWKDEGKALGWKGESELSSKDAKTLVTGFPQMADCAAVAEPGALARQGGILDLAVGCATAAGTIRIELLRSLDFGKTFNYSARLLDEKDALCLGAKSPKLNAADLFIAQGKTWLSVTPEGPDGYRGCLIVELGAGGAGVIRDGAGVPIAQRFLHSPDDRFTGACTYAEGATSPGYLISELVLESPPKVFRIFRSGEAAP
jgi:hypothetical protein